MSLLSMTGYGTARVSSGDVEIVVEMRSLNNRFLDVIWKLPSSYYSFEQELNKLVRSRLKRGRVEVFVSRSSKGASASELVFNPELFDKYIETAKESVKLVTGAEPTSLEQFALQLLNKREVVEVVPAQAEECDEYSLLEKVVLEALEAMLAMRKCEGGNLEQELASQLRELEGFQSAISQSAELAVSEFRERLSAKLERLKPEVEVDAQRLAQEVALLAERADITEEMVRLRSHIQQFRALMSGAEGGRKLEFLLQEMVREVNTTGSKSQKAEIASLVVESKAVLEKIREQIQNIE